MNELQHDDHCWMVVAGTWFKIASVEGQVLHLRRDVPASISMPAYKHFVFHGILRGLPAVRRCGG